MKKQNKTNKIEYARRFSIDDSPKTMEEIRRKWCEMPMVEHDREKKVHI